jgi:sugar lactone lactonase YvrE
MYYVDSATQRVDRIAFDLDSGTLGDRHPFIEVDADDGAPDGLAVDLDGCVWVAVVHGGEVRRYSPTGDLVARVTLPTSVVTSCCFGGPQLTELYITTSAEHVRAERRASEPLAGGLFVCDVGVPGLPVSPAATAPIE